MAETKKTKKETKIKVDSTKPDAEGFAVIETGGKQYRVAVGESIKVEKIVGEAKLYKIGDDVVFNKVLLIDNGKDLTEVGAPYLSGA